ncbi:MAG TPA: MFS transporter [Candidatus Mcinerneyibacterium sp.]|nr:MFS transporter [Candidatus Mcinerneyibacterium sp.]
MKIKKRFLLKIASFQVLAMFRRGLFYSFLSIYMRFILGLSVTETTFYATFPMILNIIFQNFIWGGLSDKYQKRKTLIVAGEILAAIGTVVVWYIHFIQEKPHMAGYMIIIGFSIIEIFWSMSNIGWTAIISDLFKAKDRASVRGKLASIGGIGRIIGVTVGGLLYDGFGNFYDGWGFHKGALFFIASAFMILSVIPVITLPEGGVKKEELISNKLDDNKKIKKVKSDKIKLFTLFILAMVFINFGRNSIATLKAQYLSLESGLNVSSRILSYIVNMRSLGIIIFGAIIGIMVKKYKEEFILLIGSIMAFLHLVGFALIYILEATFIFNLLAGISEVIIIASSYSVASKLIPPKKRGKLFAIYNATFFLSWGVAGTLIAGPITDILNHYGFSELMSYKAGFLSGALLNLIGIIILTVFISKLKHKEQKNILV